MAEDGSSSSTCVPKLTVVFTSAQRCACDECSALHSALDSLDSLSFKHPQDEAISTTIDRAYGPLRSAIKHVHHRHRPDCWDHGTECHLGGLVDEEEDGSVVANDDSAHDRDSGQASDAAGEALSPGYATQARKTGKFMVCDHCHGHGLPCNEAAVCEQCIHTGTACIHRVCRRSPNSRGNCPDSECRYLHKDYMPTRDDIPTSAYNAPPGDLRRYLVDGRAERVASSAVYWGGGVEIAQQQEHARQEMNAQVSNATTSRAEFRGACGPRCRPRLDDNTEPPEERDSLNADQEHHSGDEDAEEDGDKVRSPNTNICNLCQESAQFYGLSSCNHRICLFCTIPRRALLCDNSCPSCQEVSENVVITTDHVTDYEDFDISYVPDEKSKIIANIGAFFEDDRAHQVFDLAVEALIKCRDEDCDHVPESAKDSVAHMRTVHRLLICRECLRQAQPCIFLPWAFWDHEPQEHQQSSMILDATEIPEPESVEKNREALLIGCVW